MCPERLWPPWSRSAKLYGELWADGLLFEDLVDKLKAKSTTRVREDVFLERRQGADHRPWSRGRSGDPNAQEHRRGGRRSNSISSSLFLAGGVRRCRKSAHGPVREAARLPSTATGSC